MAPLTSYVQQHNMHSDFATIDLTQAQTALFVRQALAKFAGIPFSHEITWGDLHDSICGPANRALPSSVVLRGLPRLALKLPQEELQLRELLREMAAARPDIQVRIAIHE